MSRILVIEDESGLRANLIELLEAEGYDAVGVPDGDVGIAEALARPPDLVLCDIAMPVLDGYDVLRALRDHEITQAVPFLFLTAKRDRDEVRHGMRLGADDYLTKPFTREDLLGSIRVRLDRARTLTRARSAPPLGPVHDGRATEVLVLDPQMRALYELARRAAQGPISILLLGETGVGKDVLAREVHASSPRAAGPFVAFNCAALSDTLLESELFGHEKGAFTGAGPARAGLLESAHGGTVFLDEIGDIPMTTQVKLLRVLEDRKVMRVGGRAPISIDVRFVSATNRDIERDAERGTFRADLLFRLNGVTLHVPPLRARSSEIMPLVRVFLEASSRALGRATPEVSSEAIAAMLAHDWPGNVRELRHATERAALLAGERIELAHLPPRIAAALGPRGIGSSDRDPHVDEDLRSVSRAGIEEIERRRIEDALAACGGNQTQAAARLGISRRTLVARLSQYEFPRPRKK